MSYQMRENAINTICSRHFNYNILCCYIYTNLLGTELQLTNIPLTYRFILIIRIHFLPSLKYYIYIHESHDILFKKVPIDKTSKFKNILQYNSLTKFKYLNNNWQNIFLIGSGDFKRKYVCGEEYSSRFQGPYLILRLNFFKCFLLFYSCNLYLIISYTKLCKLILNIFLYFLRHCKTSPVNKISSSHQTLWPW